MKNLCPENIKISCKSVRKNKSIFKKEVKILNRCLMKEDIQMANKRLKMCSALLFIKEMQIKTPMRFHCTCTRMDVKKTNYPNGWQRHKLIRGLIYR